MQMVNSMSVDTNQCMPESSNEITYDKFSVNSK